MCALLKFVDFGLPFIDELLLKKDRMEWSSKADSPTAQVNVVLRVEGCSCYKVIKMTLSTRLKSLFS